MKVKCKILKLDKVVTSLKRNRNLHSKAVTVASGMTSLIAT